MSAYFYDENDVRMEVYIDDTGEVRRRPVDSLRASGEEPQGLLGSALPERDQ